MPGDALVLHGERRLATAEGEMRVAHGTLGAASVTALALGGRRAAEELAAVQALRSHPNIPAWAQVVDEWLVVPRVTLAEGDAFLTTLADGSHSVLESQVGTVEELLRALAPRADRGGAVDAIRALRRLGLPRGPLDRWLASQVQIALPRGPDFGGVDPRLRGRDAEGRVVALSLRRARADGVPELDRAAEELAGGRVRAPCSEEHVELGRDLARLDVAVRQLVWVRPGERRSRLEDFVVARVLARLRALPPRARKEPFRVFEPRRVRRERLFSRWAEGIEHDEEGLFSATPEALALRIARGLGGRVLDGTCGIGAIAIALARTATVDEVVAVDLSSERLAMARHNARIYGVEDRIRFRVADVHAVVAAERFDGIVLDPPWGGRGYDRERTTLDDLGLDLRPILSAFDGPMRLKLPRSFAPEELPGFVLEPLRDERGVVKMLLASRPRPVMVGP